jgi:hypothetical protein
MRSPQILGGSLEPLDAPLRPLCPTCGSTQVRIAVEAAVSFDVVAAEGAEATRDLQVVGHLWHDAAWDRETSASCACGWTGCVGELRAHEGTGDTGSAA